MSIRTKFVALEIAPTVTHSAERGDLTIFFYFDGRRKCRLVVDIERNEHIVLVDEVAHSSIAPHSSLHLAAVDTAKSSEVKEDRFARLTSISHTLFVVREFGFHLHHVKVEILRAHGRSKGADSLGRCTPEPWNHVDGEGERGDSQEEGRHGGLTLCFIVVGELDKSEEIASQEGEEGNPKSKESFAIKQTPTVR